MTRRGAQVAAVKNTGQDDTETLACFHMAATLDIGQVHRGSSEKLCFRLFLGTVFSMAFSIALGNLLLGLTLAAFLWYLIQERRLPRLTPVSWLAAVFVVIAIAATILGVGGKNRLSGLWTLSVLLVVGTLIVSRAGVGSVLKAFVIGCTVLSLERCVLSPIAALRETGLQDDLGFLRALIQEGSMTDGQMLMLGIIATMGLISMSRGEARRSPGWWLALALQVLALLVNFKRGSWICTFAFAGVFLVIRSGWRSMIVMLLAAVVICMLPPVRVRILDLGTERTPGGRITMWTKITPALVREHPWGVGFGSLTNEMMREHAPEVEHDRDHLHSNIPQVLVETGWIGLCVYMLWMVVGIVDGLRWLWLDGWGRRRLPTHALTVVLMYGALLGNGIVEYNFGDSELLVMCAALQGIMACVRNPL